MNHWPLKPLVSTAGWEIWRPTGWCMELWSHSLRSASGEEITSAPSVSLSLSESILLSPTYHLLLIFSSQAVKQITETLLACYYHLCLCIWDFLSAVLRVRCPSTTITCGSCWRRWRVECSTCPISSHPTARLCCGAWSRSTLKKDSRWGSGD